MLTLLARGFGLGLTAALIPGPLHTILINKSIFHGWRQAFLSAFSPLAADIPIIIVVVFIVGQVPESVLNLLQIVGGIFLLYLSWSTWNQLRDGFKLQVDGSQVTKESSLQIFIKTMIVTWLSPGPYIFWATVNGPILIEALRTSPVDALAFMVGFYGIFVLVLLGIVFGAHNLRRLPEHVVTWILRGAVIIMVLFAISLLFNGISAMASSTT